MKYDITALGEILIDFTPYGNAEDGAKLFGRNAGGAPANLLATIAKYGGRTCIFSKVGDDMFGEFLIETLKNAGIDTSCISVDTVHNTTLAFVSLDEKGDRSFSFYRRFGADVFISPDDVNTDIISNSTFFHFGSLSLTTEPAISATEFAIKNARNSGCIITYDPNYRELLWENAETSIKTMRKFLFYADIVKVSREEALMISGCEDIESSVSALLNFGISILLITDGENGVHFATAYQRGFLPSTRACVVDTTGAGDIFFGSFLYGLIKDKVCKKELEKIDITKYVRTAIHLAGKSTEKKGAISSIPPYEEYDS